MGPPPRSCLSRGLLASCNTPSLISAARRAKVRLVDSGVAQTRERRHACSVSSRAYVWSLLQALKEEIAEAPLKDAALLCLRVGSLVNALRAHGGREAPPGEGGAPSHNEGREGYPSDWARAGSLRRRPAPSTYPLGLLEAAAAVAAAVQQRLDWRRDELARALVPLLWVLTEAALPDLSAHEGPSGAPSSVVESEGERPPGDEDQGAPGGHRALLHRQQKLRSLVSSCAVKALEDAGGPPTPLQGPLWAGLAVGAAALLLANALSPRHLVCLIEDRSVTAGELQQLGELFAEALKVSLEPGCVSLAPQLQQLLRISVFSPLQLAQRCRCCLLPLLSQQTFAAATSSSRAAVAALTGGPMDSVCPTSRSSRRPAPPLSVWTLAATFLWRTLKCANWEIRLNAVCLWQLLCSPLPIKVQLETREVLQQILEDPSPTVRQAGVCFLLQLLRRCCCCSSSRSRQDVLLEPAALTGLLELLLAAAGDRASPSLRCLLLTEVTALLHQNHTSEQPMALALRQLVPRLLQLVQDSDTSVRLAAALLLEAAPAALPPLLPSILQQEQQEQQRQQQQQRRQILGRCVFDGLVGSIGAEQQRRLLQLSHFRRKQQQLCSTQPAAATTAAAAGAAAAPFRRSCIVQGNSVFERRSSRIAGRSAALAMLRPPHSLQQQQQLLLLPGVLAAAAAAAAAAGPLEVSKRLASHIWMELLSLPLQQQVQTLKFLSREHTSLLYVLGGLVGAPLEGPWLTVAPGGKRGPLTNYIDRCKLAAGLFRVIESELSAAADSSSSTSLRLTEGPPSSSPQSVEAQKGPFSLEVMSCLYTCGALVTPRGHQDLTLFEGEAQLRHFFEGAFPAPLLLCRARGPFSYCVWQLILRLPGPLFGLSGGPLCNAERASSSVEGASPSSYNWISPGAALVSAEGPPWVQEGVLSPYKDVLQQFLLLTEDYLEGRCCCCAPPLAAAAVGAAAAAADAAFTAAAAAAGEVRSALERPPVGAPRRTKRRRGPLEREIRPSAAPVAAGRPPSCLVGDPSEQSALFIEVLLPFLLQHPPLRQRFLGALWGRLLCLVKEVVVLSKGPRSASRLQGGPCESRRGASKSRDNIQRRPTRRGGDSLEVNRSSKAAEREAQDRLQYTSSSSNSNSECSSSSSSDSSNNKSDGCWGPSGGTLRLRRASRRVPGTRGSKSGSRAFISSTAAATAAAATAAAAAETAAAKDQLAVLLAGSLGASQEEGWKLTSLAAALEIGALLRAVPEGREALGLGGPPCSLRGARGAQAEPGGSGSSSRKRQLQQQQQDQQQSALLPQQLLVMGTRAFFEGLVGVLLEWGPFVRPAAGLLQLLRGPQDKPLPELLPLPLRLFLGLHREKLMRQQQQQQELLMRALAAQRGLLRQSLSFFLGTAHLAAAYGCTDTSRSEQFSSWRPLEALVRALGSPRFPKRGSFARCLEEEAPRQGHVHRLKAWLRSSQCILEIYGVVLEHLAVMLGTEAPPVPATAVAGAPEGPLEPRAPCSRVGLPTGASLALKAAAMLPKLIKALFGWLDLMESTRAVAPPIKAVSRGPTGGPPEGGEASEPLLAAEALQRLRRLAWRSVEGAVLGAFRFLNSCALPGLPLHQQQHQHQQQQQQQPRGEETGGATAAVGAEPPPCSCCCCRATANARARSNSNSGSKHVSKISNKSSSRRNGVGGMQASFEAQGRPPRKCLLSQACLEALARALVHWGPFVSDEAVKDLLQRIHSLFPEQQQQLLLQSLKACAAAAAAAVPEGVPQQTSEGALREASEGAPEGGSPCTALRNSYPLLAPVVGAAIPSALQRVLKEAIAVVAATVSDGV
ncbi:hypothetical protein Esti_001598 [Eimeria stiedai]